MQVVSAEGVQNVIAKMLHDENPVMRSKAQEAEALLRRMGQKALAGEPPAGALPGAPQRSFDEHHDDQRSIPSGSGAGNSVIGANKGAGKSTNRPPPPQDHVNNSAILNINRPPPMKMQGHHVQQHDVALSGAGGGGAATHTTALDRLSGTRMLEMSAPDNRQIQTQQNAKNKTTPGSQAGGAATGGPPHNATWVRTVDGRIIQTRTADGIPVGGAGPGVVGQQQGAAGQPTTELALDKLVSTGNGGTASGIKSTGGNNFWEKLFLEHLRRRAWGETIRSTRSCWSRA